MHKELSPIDAAKRASAEHAAELVESGMVLGLGTGSTAEWLVRALGRMVREDGLKISAAATSSRTAALARQEGIEIIDLDAAGRLDLTIDGADEFDAELRLIKGGGGAHLQEKIVAAASDRMVVIADASKEVKTLGAFPLPLEVIPFGAETTRALVEEVLETQDVLGRETAFREKDGALFISDEGNRILDLHLKRIGDPFALSNALNHIPGVVENGLFINLCDLVIIGHPDGSGEEIGPGGARRKLDAPDGSSDNIFTEIADDR